MNELALFAGAGGGILASHLLGWRTVCAVEIDDYARSVLLTRQNDGSLRPFPVWDDITTFDARPWRGIVDVVSGGFPCQDLSLAGKGAGLDGHRSGLWREMFRIVGQVRPRFVFVENSPALTTRGLGRVVSDLAALGFRCQWTVMGAADVGAPHQRDRLWLVADAPPFGSEAGDADPETRGEGEANVVDYGGETISDADSERPQRRTGGRNGKEASSGNLTRSEAVGTPGKAWGGWPAEPDVGRVADGVAARVDRLRAIGNGQVPRVAAAAWLLLTHNAEVTGA